MAHFPLRNFTRSMQKPLLRTSFTFPASFSSSFTVEYLVNSCGLGAQTAILTSRKLMLKEKKLNRYKVVLDLFKSYGFTHTHLEKLIAKHPHVLQSRFNRNLESKLQYLTGSGFSGSLLPDLIVKNPSILKRSLIGQLKPAIEFFEAYLGTSANVVAAISRCSWLLTSTLRGTLQANIDLLINEGMPPDKISKLIMLQPRSILQAVDRVAQGIETIKKLGLKPSDPMFVNALRVWLSLSKKTWMRKLEFFMSLGWTEVEIMLVFKHSPGCMVYTEEKMKSKIDFYLNSLKLERSFLIAHPWLLTISLDTRIRPRYNMLKLLQFKRLVKEPENMQWLSQTNERFLKNYVIKHLDAVPNLVELYHQIVPAGKEGMSAANEC